MMELHDSVVAGLVEIGSQIVVFLRLVVHRRVEVEGRTDTGTCWVQAAALVVADGALDGVLPELPADIWTGRLTVDGMEPTGLIPVPFDLRGEIALSLHLYSDTKQKIGIVGTRATLTLLGDAVYMDDFRPT